VGKAGIFITQIGASVPTAADYQFVFNSDWPSLQCTFDQTVTLGIGGNDTLVHNLGYYPLTIGWVTSVGFNSGRIFAPSENLELTPQTDVSMSFDKKNIYLANTGSEYQVCVKCYNVDISKAVDYTFPQFPSINQPYDKTVGIKVSKYNKQLTSTDLRDFILHSRAQSPAVLSVVTGNSNDGAIHYNNPPRYVPWTFAFYQDNTGKYSGLAPGFQGAGAAFKLGRNLSFTDLSGHTTTGVNGAVMSATTGNTNMSLVILRDPLVAASSVEVQY
jgi:hypothetical protein